MIWHVMLVGMKLCLLLFIVKSVDPNISSRDALDVESCKIFLVNASDVDVDCDSIHGNEVSDLFIPC